MVALYGRLTQLNQQLSTNTRDEKKLKMKKYLWKKKLKMKKWFLLIDYEQLLYTNTFNLKQGNKSIEEYTKEFYELSIQNQVRER